MKVDNLIHFTITFTFWQSYGGCFERRMSFVKIILPPVKEARKSADLKVFPAVSEVIQAGKTTCCAAAFFEEFPE
jgi:hypothetical protein